MIPRDKRNHRFSVSNLRPVFEKVKFDVRRSLEPFKDLDGRFDPSSTALTKRSQTLSNMLESVAQRYHRILNCVVNLLS